MTASEHARLMDALDRGFNFCGPLNPHVRARLFALVDEPTPATWDDAHSILLRSSLRRGTVWQAILEIDPTFPDQGQVTDADGKVVRPWPRIPDPDLVLRAIEHAVAEEDECPTPNR